MRTTRKGVSTAFWRGQQEKFCHEGRLYARRFKTAGAAWHACENGCFMAYWLTGILNVSMRSEMIQLNTAPNVGFAYSEEEFTSDQLKSYADNLRRVFRVDGTRK